MHVNKVIVLPAVLVGNAVSPCSNVWVAGSNKSDGTDGMAGGMSPRIAGERLRGDKEWPPDVMRKMENECKVQIIVYTDASSNPVVCVARDCRDACPPNKHPHTPD